MSATVRSKGGKALKKALEPWLDQGRAVVFVGILKGATRSGETGQSMAAIAAAHEFGTSHIPARSFMRSTLAKRGSRWAQAVAAYLGSNPGKIREALALAGETASKDIKAAIEEGIAPPLAQKTIRAKMRRKGSKGKAALPLADTGAMLETISYEVQS